MRCEFFEAWDLKREALTIRDVPMEGAHLRGVPRHY